MKEIADHITQLKRVGRGLGEYIYDKETMNEDDQTWTNTPGCPHLDTHIYITIVINQRLSFLPNKSMTRCTKLEAFVTSVRN